MAAKDKAYHAKNRTKRNAQSTVWRLNNLEKHRRTSRENAARVRKDEPLRYLLRKAKHRAKQLGMPFNLTISDLAIPLVCPLLGVWLSPGAKKVGPHSPTLDRKDPTKGYIAGNVWVVSYRANTAKNDLSLTEFLRMADNMRRLLLD